MRIAMLADNDALFDSRIRRGAKTLAAAGHHVCVFCIGRGAAPKAEESDGVYYRRRPMPRLKDVLFGAAAAEKSGNAVTGKAPTNNTTPAEPAATPSPLRRLVGEFIVFKAIERAFMKDVSAFRPDIIHAHDLATLPAGARLAAQTGAQLIYDAHELEWDRNADYPAALVAYRRRCERRYIRAADNVITVSPSIANFLSEKYAIPAPSLIFNAPAVHREKSCDTIRKACSVGPETPLGVYIGALKPNRGLEQIIAAARKLNDITIAFLGPGEPSYIAQLRNIARDAGVHDLIHFLNPRPSDKVVSFVRDADFSFVLIQDICLSYRYALPNKLLESAFARLPVVASNLPDISAFVRRFQCGVVVDQTAPGDIAVGVQDVLKSPDAYRVPPSLLDPLDAEYSAEAQQRALLQIYDDLQHLNTKRAL